MDNQPEELIRKYKTLDIVEKQRLYVETLVKIERAIQVSNIDELKKLSELISYISSIEENKVLLQTFYNDDNNPIKMTNLVILSCKYNQPEVLNYLFNTQAEILNNLSIDIGRRSIQPHDRDEKNHNAFSYAIRSTSIKLVEMLYDYWLGDLHWLEYEVGKCEKYSYVIDNLKILKQSINDAGNDFSEQFSKLKSKVQGTVKEAQFLVDVHGIIKFNDFQVELYTELGRLSANNDIAIADAHEAHAKKYETEAIKNVILTVFRVYEKYSDESEFRLQHILPENEELIKKRLQDKTTLHGRYHLYQMYQLYLRKVDFNVALLILDHLYLLKQRLEMADGLYQEIESQLYFFIFHLKNNRETDFNKRLSYIPLFYLYKRDFQKTLYKFRDGLEKMEITDNTIKDKLRKIPNLEVNSLTILPYLRDSFSINKILEYIEVLSVDFKKEKNFGYLVVERTFQIIGEFMKSTDESLHLSPITEALFQAEISIEAIKQLKHLRDLLSHIDKGKLLVRIEVEKHKSDFLNKIYCDLQEVKRGIKEVFQIHTSRVQESLIKKGINLLNIRRDEIFEEIPESKKIDIIVYLHYVTSLQEAVQEGIYPYSLSNMILDSKRKEAQDNSGLSDGLIKELEWIYCAVNALLKKRGSARENINSLMINKIPLYIKIIQAMQLDIKNQVSNISDIRGLLSQVKIDMDVIVGSSNFNKENIAKIKELLKKVNPELDPDEKVSSKIREKLGLIKELSSQWNLIKELLEFIVEERNFFESHHWEIKKNHFTRMLKNIDDFPTETGVNTVDELLASIKYEKNINGDETIGFKQGVNRFEGIKELESLLKKPIFVTSKEKDIILNNIPDEKKQIGPIKLKLIDYYDKKIELEKSVYESLVETLDINKKNKEMLKSDYGDEENFISCKNIVEASPDHYKRLLNKLNQNDPIDRRDYTLFQTLLLEDKAKKILSKLIRGTKPEPRLLECFNTRIYLLNEILDTRERDINQPFKNQLVFRYMNNKKFRVMIEILLIDLMNIWKEITLKKPLHKSLGLLTGINLRNVLAHGNPLLEIIGNILRPNDLAIELISKALTFIEDGKSTHAFQILIEQTDGKIPIEELINKIKNNLVNELSQEQQSLINEFKKSNQWEDYLNLISITQYQQKTHLSLSKFGIHRLPDVEMPPKKQSLDLPSFELKNR